MLSSTVREYFLKCGFDEVSWKLGEPGRYADYRLSQDIDVPLPERHLDLVDLLQTRFGIRPLSTKTTVSNSMMKTVLPDMTVRILHPAQRALVAGCRLAGLLAALALPACSENIRQREQDISDAMERHRQILEEQQIVQAINARAGRIEVSEEKAWLYQPYSASYSDGLRQTLPRIVPYPITYAIKNDYNPKVNSTAQANHRRGPPGRHQPASQRRLPVP